MHHNSILVLQALWSGVNLMRILQILISLVGIIANLTVVFAFLNHKQLRGKIPNRFMVNQVSSMQVLRLSILNFKSEVRLFGNNILNCHREVFQAMMTSEVLDLLAMSCHKTKNNVQTTNSIQNLPIHQVPNYLHQ